MGVEVQSNPEAKQDDIDYIDPEELTSEEIEVLLKEGQVLNIRPIEAGPQAVPHHTDRVLIGDMDAPITTVEHKDIVEVADIEVPWRDKKMLVVYKPDSGVEYEAEEDEKIVYPDNSSPHSHKETAAWVVAKSLQFSTFAPAVLRDDLPEGKGVLKPYIFGEPLELLDSGIIGRAKKTELEEIALFDYIAKTMDRHTGNLLWVEKRKHLVAIDNAATFFNDQFSELFRLRGPRLMIGYDNKTVPSRLNTTVPPKLKRTPIPENLLGSLKNFIGNRTQIESELAKLLTNQEINDIFKNAQKALEAGVFL